MRSPSDARERVAPGGSVVGRALRSWEWVSSRAVTAKSVHRDAMTCRPRLSSSPRPKDPT
jgi:hypothetical protein